MTRNELIKHLEEAVLPLQLSALEYNRKRVVQNEADMQLTEDTIRALKADMPHEALSSKSGLEVSEEPLPKSTNRNQE